MKLPQGDIHTYNQNFAGLKSRDEARGIYLCPLLYGAGNERLDKLLGNATRGGTRTLSVVIPIMPFS